MLLLVGITECATFNNKYVSSRTMLEPDNIKFHNGIFDMTTDSGYNKDENWKQSVINMII